MDNYFEYTIRVFDRCRTTFNHRPYARREEWNQTFRAAIQSFLRQTQEQFETQPHDTWTSVPMAAPQPLMPHNIHAFPQTQGPLGYHDCSNELQRQTDRLGVGGMPLTSQGQQANYNPHAFLKPQDSFNISRAQNCSSQTSMRSGASSTSNIDIDTFATPGTSQDGHLDVANHMTSSTSSSLFLPPQAGASRKSGHPSFEPPETILPDQRRPTAPHNITTPMEISQPKLTVDPVLLNPMSWDRRTATSQESPIFSESIVYGELGNQRTWGWPSSYYGLHSANAHYQSDPPESWDPSQDS